MNRSDRERPGMGSDEVYESMGADLQAFIARNSQQTLTHQDLTSTQSAASNSSTSRRRVPPSQRKRTVMSCDNCKTKKIRVRLEWEIEKAKKLSVLRPLLVHVDIALLADKNAASQQSGSNDHSIMHLKNPTGTCWRS